MPAGANFNDVKKSFDRVQSHERRQESLTESSSVDTRSDSASTSTRCSIKRTSAVESAQYIDTSDASLISARNHDGKNSNSRKISTISASNTAHRSSAVLRAVPSTDIKVGELLLQSEAPGETREISSRLLDVLTESEDSIQCSSVHPQSSSTIKYFSSDSPKNLSSHRQISITTAASGSLSTDSLPSSGSYSVRLEGGHPWGIRLDGGYEYGQHIRIAHVKSGGNAYKQGVRVGDNVVQINDRLTEGLELCEALHLLHTNSTLQLQLDRRGSRLTAIPVLRIQSPDRDGKSDNEMTSRSSQHVSVDGREKRTGGNRQTRNSYVQSSNEVFPKSDEIHRHDAECRDKAEFELKAAQRITGDQTQIAGQCEDRYGAARKENGLSAFTWTPRVISRDVEEILATHKTSTRFPGILCFSTDQVFDPKLSEPSEQSNNLELRKRHADADDSQCERLDRPRRRGDPSRYISDPGFGSSIHVKEPIPEEDEEIVREAGSTPPRFNNIADFERRYGTCVPQSVPTSPSRKKFIYRQADIIPGLPLAQEPLSKIPGRRSLKDCPEDGQLRDCSPKHSKGLEMFFNQRAKNVDDELLPEQSDNGLVDTRVIEKRIVSPSRLVKTSPDILDRKCPDVKEREIVKSSVEIKLHDSEDSNDESVRGPRRMSRRIAVKSVGKTSVDELFPADSSRSRLDLLPCSKYEQDIRIFNNTKESGYKDRIKGEVNEESHRGSKQTNITDIKMSSQVVNNKSPQLKFEDDTQRNTCNKVFNVLRTLETGTDLSFEECTNTNDVMSPKPLRPSQRDSKVLSEGKLNDSRPLEKMPSADAPPVLVERKNSRAPRTANYNVRSGVVQYSADAEPFDSALITNPPVLRSTGMIRLFNDGEDKKSSQMSVAKPRQSSETVSRQTWRRRSEEDDRLCDTEYWLKLGGLENKEPKTATMILHPHGYTSDTSETTLNRQSKSTGSKEIKDLPSNEKKKNVTKLTNHARVLYDFEAQNNNELSVKKDVVIRLLQQIDKNWYQCELNNAKGLIPANYIQILATSDSQTPRVRFDAATVSSCNDRVTSSKSQGSLPSFKVDATVGSSCSKQLGRRGELFSIHPNQMEHRRQTDQSVNDSTTVLLPGGEESPRSLSPLSSILPTNAALSPEIDGDLDQLIYDALLAIHDASYSGEDHCCRINHLPTSQKGHPTIQTSSRPSQHMLPPAPNAVTKLSNPRSLPSSVSLRQPQSRSSTLYDQSTPPCIQKQTPDIRRFSQPNEINSYTPNLKRTFAPNTPSHVAHDSPVPDSWHDEPFRNEEHEQERDNTTTSNAGDDYDGATYELDSRTIATTTTPLNLKRLEPYSLKFQEPWYHVLYNYTPQHDDELELRQGDLIYLLERCDDGWCVGHADRTKRLGTFPGNYVTQLR